MRQPLLIAGLTRMHPEKLYFCISLLFNAAAPTTYKAHAKHPQKLYFISTLSH